MGGTYGMTKTQYEAGLKRLHERNNRFDISDEQFAIIEEIVGDASNFD